MESTDIKQICRLCAKEDKFCIDIFGEDGVKNNISKKIRLCLPITVSSGEHYCFHLYFVVGKTQYILEVVMCYSDHIWLDRNLSFTLWCYVQYETCMEPVNWFKIF